MPEDTYFASPELEYGSEDIGKKLYAKVENYDKDRLTSEVYSRLRAARNFYYGFDPAGFHATSGVLRAGEQGELAEIRINHSRALVNTLLNLVVAPEVAWAAKATNADYDSAGQCVLAQALLEYYWHERQVIKYCVRACEEAIAFTEGFLYTPWDETLGEDYAADPKTGQTVRTGDVSFRTISTWDVVRDPRAKSWDEVQWVILKIPLNKWDLIARFPDRREEIMTVPDEVQPLNPGGPKRSLEKPDDVLGYFFWHKRTPAVPDGRYTFFLSGTVVLEDRELGDEYETIPLHRIAPAELIGTPYGYSPYLEILGIQELIDSLHSSIATNQTTFSTQCIAIPRGSETSPEAFAGGMRAIYFDPNAPPPQALQLTKSPPETFAHLKDLKHDQEQLFGLNAVVRGTPEGSSRSGRALALLQSQALQQASNIQKNYTALIESIGTCVIRLLKVKATVERRVSITGKANQYLDEQEPFTGKKLSQIRKVSITIGNPLSQTAAGREEIAEKYIQLQLIKTPEQLEQVLSTGRIEPLTQSLQKELLLISSENEDISKGVPPPVLIHDDHRMHGREHRPTMSNREARKSPEILKAGMKHIHDHYAAYYGVPNPPQDPNYRPKMLMLMGMQPPAPDAPPPGANAPPPPSPLAMKAEQFMAALLDGQVPGAAVTDMVNAATDILDKHMQIPGGPGPGPGPGGPPPPPKGPPPGPKPPPPPGPKPPPGPATPQPTNPNPGPEPKLPTNPATGKTWNPVDGGQVVQ